MSLSAGRHPFLFGHFLNFYVTKVSCEQQNIFPCLAMKDKETNRQKENQLKRQRDKVKKTQIDKEAKTPHRHR